MFVAMSALLFARPDLFRTVVASVITFGFLLILPLAAIVAWALLAPRSAARAGIKVHQRPSLGFVGSEGVGTRLGIVEAPRGRIRVEWAVVNYIFVIVGLALSGPGLGLLLAMRQGTHPIPLPMLGLLSAFVAGATVLLAWWTRKALRRRPALDITRDAIVLALGTTVERRIAQRDIDGLRIEPHSYVSSEDGPASAHPNFILTARLTDGSDVRLCISDNREQVDSLKARIRSVMFLGPDRGPPGI